MSGRIRRRRALMVSLLALLGVLAAGGLGLAVNEIAGDSIGLSAKPLEAGDVLAPSQARDEGSGGRQRRRRASRDEDSRAAGTPTQAAPRATVPTAPEAGEEGRGRGRGRGRAGNSGSGSAGSGSSGSGNSGSDD